MSLRIIQKNYFLIRVPLIRKFCVETKNVNRPMKHAPIKFDYNMNNSNNNIDNWQDELHLDAIRTSKSPLDECTEDISHVAPNLRPAFNFAAYIDNSPTLQELLKLGVNLHKIEKRPDLAGKILQLDFERDIKQHLLFLHDLKVPADQFGRFLTKNSMIFNEDLDSLTRRIDYLRSKKFSDEMITRIVSQNPYWLLFPVDKIDRRLGFFQENFSLSGNEVRKLTVKQPRLITYKMEHIRLNTFVIKEEMGFDSRETKQILLLKPKLWMLNQNSIVNRFVYLHKTMQIPHKMICHTPEALFCRKSRLKERHIFLTRLNRAIYDPTQENYVSLLDLVQGTDVEFVENVAKSTIEEYNRFLKTL